MLAAQRSSMLKEPNVVASLRSANHGTQSANHGTQSASHGTQSASHGTPLRPQPNTAAAADLILRMRAVTSPRLRSG